MPESPNKKTRRVSDRSHDNKWSSVLSSPANAKMSRKVCNIPPPGYISGRFDNKNNRKSKTVDHDEMVKKSAMAVGQAPGKQLLMTAFMLWMSGSTIQIFSIMMTFMALFQPVKALMSFKNAFSKYENSSVNITAPKALYIFLHLLGICLGIFKLNVMGLLPIGGHTNLYDHIKIPIEFSSGSLAF